MYTPVFLLWECCCSIVTPHCQLQWISVCASFVMYWQKQSWSCCWSCILSMSHPLCRLSSLHCYLLVFCVDSTPLCGTVRKCWTISGHRTFQKAQSMM